MSDCVEHTVDFPLCHIKAPLKVRSPRTHNTKKHMVHQVSQRRPVRVKHKMHQGQIGGSEKKNVN